MNEIELIDISLSKNMKLGFLFRWFVCFIILSAMTSAGAVLLQSAIESRVFVGYFLLYISLMLDFLLLYGMIFFLVFSKRTIKKITVEKDHIIINKDRYEKNSDKDYVFELNTDIFALFPFLSRKLNVLDKNKKVIKSYWFGPCWNKKLNKIRNKTVRALNTLIEYERYLEHVEEVENNKLENWSRTTVTFQREQIRNDIYKQDSFILAICIIGLLISMYLKVDDSGLTTMLLILRIVTIICIIVWMIKATMEFRMFRTMPSKIEVGPNGIRIDDEMFLKEEIERLSFNFSYINVNKSPIPAVIYIYARGRRYRYYLGNMDSECCIEPRKILYVAIKDLFVVPTENESADPDNSEKEAEVSDEEEK